MTRNPTLAAPLAIGVDVGGTKIAAAVVDAGGRIAGFVRAPTDTSQPSAVLDSIVATVRQALAAAEVRADEVAGVGLGIPGLIDRERGIARLAVNLGWRDEPARAQLEASLGMPCAIENDVAVAALGESRYGLGRGRASMTYLSLGTGIAARTILDGTLLRGATGLAGDIGQVVLVPDGPLCACGARGCLEALASGPTIAREAAAALAAGRASSLGARPGAGEGLRAEDVSAAAAEGDALAVEILAAAGAHIAFGIYVLALTVNSEIIVLGGGLAQANGPLVTAIRAGVARWRRESPVFRAALDADSVLVSALSKDAAVLGAASLILAPQRATAEGRL
jgi:glucokinase